MRFDPYDMDRDYGAPSGVITEAQYTARTFLWMMLGLLISFGVAVLSWFTNLTLYLYVITPMFPLVLAVITLVLSLTFSVRIEKLSVASAQMIFVVYSALMGLTLSTWLYLYQLSSVVLVFLVAALYFGALAAYGHLTHRNLAGIGTILLSGLVVLILFGVLSLFLPGMTAMDSLVSLFSIALFLGCTAYDTQRIRQFYYYYSGYPDMMEKASIFSALQLYLDFINLFLYLLRFLGNRRN